MALVSSRIKVRIAGVKSLMEFLIAIEDKEFLNNLKSKKLLEMMLKTIVESIKNSKDDAMDLMNNLNELIENSPEFFETVFEDIL